MSFSGRLIGAVTLVTMVTLGGAFTAVYLTVIHAQQRHLDDALRRVADEEAGEVAAGSEHALSFSDRPGPAANDVGPLAKYAALYAVPSGAVLASTPNFSGRPPPRRALSHPPGRCFNLWFGREHLRAVLVPLPRRGFAQLLLAAPRKDLDGDAALLGRAMAWVFAAAVLWALCVARWIFSRLTQAHKNIARVARRVADGDLSARVLPLSRDREVAQLARDLNHMIERMEALLCSQRRFIAHAAHELRSPLTTLYGELSYALRRPRDQSSYQEVIEEALDSARRLKLLSEDLLTLARLDATRSEPTEQLHPADIIHQALRTVRSAAGERGVRIITRDAHDASTAVSVQGRPLDLTRMLRNLLENAVRHCPPGGEVEIAVAGSRAGVEITVADTGPGISEDDRERIFEPFYRGPRERASEVPGTGLGLAIVREIARVHGGDVTLGQNRARPGAAFIVRLPAC